MKHVFVKNDKVVAARDVSYFICAGCGKEVELCARRFYKPNDDTECPGKHSRGPDRASSYWMTEKTEPPVWHFFPQGGQWAACGYSKPEVLREGGAVEWLVETRDGSPTENKCPKCACPCWGSGWIHHQHPMKPPGVIMMVTPCQECNADGARPDRTATATLKVGPIESGSGATNFSTDWPKP